MISKQTLLTTLGWYKDRLDNIYIPKKEITQASYDVLSEEEKNNGTMYLITDASDVGTAEQIVYNNTNSGLDATNVQGAIDEITSEYLPLTGGTLTGNVTISTNTSRGLNIQKTDNGTASIVFTNSLGSLGTIGMNTVDGNLLRYNANGNKAYTLLDTDNFSTHLDNNYLSLSGGTLRGALSEPTLKWYLGDGTEDSGYVSLRRIGSSGSYTVGLPYTDADGNTTYHNLINADGNRAWVSRTGDTISGSLTVNGNMACTLTTAATIYTRVGNSNRSGCLYVGSGGYFGLYDYTNSKWVLQSDTSRNIMLGDSANTYVRLVSNGYALQFGEGLDNDGTTSLTPRTTSGGACDDKLILGAASSRWHQIYCKNAANTTSDIRDKNIFKLDNRYKELFMKLNTIGFTWKDEDNGSVHIGLGAQPTEQAALDCGLKTNEFGAIVHDYWKTPSEDGRTDRYSIAYDEIAMLTIPVVQNHEREIQSLKEEIAELKSIVQKLTA